MALEGETELGTAVRDGLVAGPLRLGGLLAEVLDADAPFDRPHREALLVREDGHTPIMTAAGENEAGETPSKRHWVSLVRE